MSLSNMIILSGSSNPELSQKIAQSINQPLGKIEIRKFSDGEIFAQIGENVRGRSAFVVQSTCTPVNDNLQELLIIIDALKRSSAGQITAVMPYYGYARQDRKSAPRTPITAKLVANQIQTAGANRVVFFDLHANQIQGFFDILCDNLYASKVIIPYLKDGLVKAGDEWVMVSPDAGGMERARFFAKQLGTAVAMVDKRREAANMAKAMNLVGDVSGKKTVIVDDMIDTAGTLKAAAEMLKERGALEVYAVATHPVFSGSAIERIADSPISQVIVTDTIPLSPQARACPKIVQLSVGELLGQGINRIFNGESLSDLFLEAR